MFECVEKFGVEGEIVEMDESKFGKQKYNVGRELRASGYLVVFVEIQKEFFMVPVEFRDSDTLF